MIQPDTSAASSKYTPHTNKNSMPSINIWSISKTKKNHVVPRLSTNSNLKTILKWYAHFDYCNFASFVL